MRAFVRECRFYLAAVLLAGIVRLVPKGEARVFRAILELCEALKKAA